jgi:ATP citrate (pro-S)-lyase
MSAKAIREASGKDLINRNLAVGTAAAKCKFAAVAEGADWTELLLSNPWLKQQVKAHVMCELDVG